MRKNKPLVFAYGLALATLLLFGGQVAVAQVTGPDVVSGDTYTVTYTRQGTTTYLQEKVGSGGTWVNITSVNGGSGGVPYTFYGKPAGEYFYRTNVRTVGYRGIVTWWTSAEKRIVVMGPLPSNRDTIANQMRYTYQARIGDINYDGLLDLFVSRVTGGSAGNGSLQDIILRNLSGGTFATDTPTAAQVSTASSWPLSSIELKKMDMNLDGFLDLSIPELGNYIAGAFGQILVAPGGAGAAAQRVIPMDARYNRFMSHTKGWMQNPNYFIENSPTFLFPIWGYVYRCDYVWRNDYYEWVCGYFWEIVGYEVQLDTSWADQDALLMRYSFSTYVNGILQPVILPGSAEGQTIDARFTSMFGVLALRGGFRSYCIDWDYDTDTYHPPCVDWAEALLRVLRDLLPEERTDDWRYLTAGEKFEARYNGMQIVDVDQVRVYNHGYQFLWFDNEGSVHHKDGNIYVGVVNETQMPWSNDYSVDVGYQWYNMSIFVHELMHVYQYRTLGCGTFCRLRVGPRWYTSPQDYVYMPINKPFYDYNLEAQASMVRDRYRLYKFLGPWNSGNSGVDLPMLNTAIPFPYGQP